jgi:cyclin-dependent kinase 17
MVNGRPLFPGSSVEDQLKLIFSLLGTPPKGCWPNLDIPYKFPKYERGPINHEVPRLDSTAINLFEEFLQVRSAGALFLYFRMKNIVRVLSYCTHFCLV